MVILKLIGDRPNNRQTKIIDNTIVENVVNIIFLDELNDEVLSN